MRNQRLFLALVATISSVMAAASHADITKCVDRNGRTSYSSEGIDTCSPQNVISHIATSASDYTVSATAPRVMSRVVSEKNVVRESSWAQPPATLHRTLTDASTVREAYANLQAIDRALSSMRTQKVASSH